MMGWEGPDVIELEGRSSRALEVARTFRDTNLEIRALADSGLALISLGRTADGLKRLDEALTAVISGEVRDLVTCGFTCCAVVSACSLLGDIDRLTRLIENLRRVASERFNGFQPPILTSHCHQPYGGMPPRSRICQRRRRRGPAPGGDRRFACLAGDPSHGATQPRSGSDRAGRGRLGHTSGGAP